MDSMRITILEDGTIKTETDRVSAPNHSNAESFLRLMATLTGGKTERRHKRGILGAVIHAAQHLTGGH